MGRKIEDFLTTYLEYTLDQESPECFHFWSGVAAICACLQQKTWIDREQYHIYPNVYVVLVSDSGICRKTTAVKIAEKLLLGMGDQSPTMLPQRATPEALVKELKNAIEQDHILKRSICSGTIVIHELDAMFSGDERRKKQMLTLLTDLYDVPTQYNAATITRKRETLHYPCLTMIGASTMEWLKDIVGERGVGGGFASRVYFIHADVTDRFIPNPKKDKKLRDLLISDLFRISDYRGPWVLDPNAHDWFVKYYRACHTFAHTCEKPLRGYASRKCDHMLRIALVLSVSAGVGDYLIRQDFMERASECVQAFEGSLSSIYDDMQSTTDGKLRGDVYEFIKSREEVQRQAIVKRFHRRANAKQIEECLSTLCEAGLLELCIGNRRSQSYRYVEQTEK